MSRARARVVRGRLATVVDRRRAPSARVSIPLAVAAFVVPVALGRVVLRATSGQDAVGRSQSQRARWRWPRSVAIVGVRLRVVVGRRVPVPGARERTGGTTSSTPTRWRRNGELLLDDRFAGEAAGYSPIPPAVGAVYGSFLILDGVSSWSLTAGIVFISALAVLSVYAAGAALWGRGAGLVAAGAYAVAPIRLGPRALARARDDARDGLRAPRACSRSALLFRGARGRRRCRVPRGDARRRGGRALDERGSDRGARRRGAARRPRREARAVGGAPARRAARLVERRDPETAGPRGRARVCARGGCHRAPLAPGRGAGNDRWTIASSTRTG